MEDLASAVAAEREGHKPDGAELLLDFEFPGGRRFIVDRLARNGGFLVSLDNVPSPDASMVLTAAELARIAHAFALLVRQGRL